MSDTLLDSKPVLKQLPLSDDERSQPLPCVADMRDAYPVKPASRGMITANRAAVDAVLGEGDDRMLVIVGPCSLHHPGSALEYAGRLVRLQEQVGDKLLLVMRAYLEKPRTTLGWKGYVYDPDLDDSNDLVKGLNRSRELLVALCETGLPLATEALSPMVHAYFRDLISWTAIGARTTESQIHREMASNLPSAVGFKNGTDGSLASALAAIRSAAAPHVFPGMNDSGHCVLLSSFGNAGGHLVLRGGRSGPNYSPAAIDAAVAACESADVPAQLVVDCSHDNSGRTPARQAVAAQSVVTQRRQGRSALRGIMLESHLEGGGQPATRFARAEQSVTDPCLGWDETKSLLCDLAARL